MKTTTRQLSNERYSPIWQIVISRLREFYREPEALFWVYGFPILMVVGLGIAFRNQPIEKITVDVAAGPRAEAVVETLAAQPRFVAAAYSDEQSRLRLRTGKTDLVVTATSETEPNYEFLFDPSRPPSMLRATRWTMRCNGPPGGRTWLKLPSRNSTSRAEGISTFSCRVCWA